MKKFEQYIETPSPLRASGNLGYIQFLQVLQKIWIDAHPDIPLVAEGGKEYETYPIITYRLDLRRPLQDEPKPKLREQVFTVPGEPNIIIKGQRFQNIVTFTVITNSNPILAEEVVEVFENFIIEFTSVFKFLGLSEIVYARRLPDQTGSRGKGLGVTMRSVSYLVTTEKIIKTTQTKLEKVAISARKFLDDPYWVYTEATPATPFITTIVDNLSGHD
jgi:hypothetical protein